MHQIIYIACINGYKLPETILWDMFNVLLPYIKAGPSFDH